MFNRFVGFTLALAIAVGLTVPGHRRPPVAAAVERGVIPAATADTSKTPANDNRTGQGKRPAPRRPIRRYASSFAL